MATFTMTLEEAIAFSPDIGLNDYPIFDEEYRPILNKKILDEFWNQEIGIESVSMFRHALKREMNKIMPLFNQRYLSEKLKFDPLSTMRIKSITEVTGTSESTSKDVSTGSSEADTATDNVGSSMATAYNYPQQQLQANTDRYASSAQKNESKNNTGSKVNESNKRESTDTALASQDGKTDYLMEGYQGSPALLLMQLRDSFINIDEEIIERIEADQLFMLVYANGESFYERSKRRGYLYPTY